MDGTSVCHSGAVLERERLTGGSGESVVVPPLSRTAKGEVLLPLPTISSLFTKVSSVMAEPPSEFPNFNGTP